MGDQVKTVKRPEHGGASWSEVTGSIRGLARTVPADVNDAPFPPSPEVMKALCEALSFVQWAPDTWADGLRGIIAETHQLGPENVVVDAGSSPLIARAIDIATADAGEVVLLAPTYSEYEAAVRRHGAQVVPAQLRPEKGFRLHPDAVLSVVGRDTRALLICNPNNPTGSALDRGALLQLLDALPRHVYVIVDEVYADFAPEVSVLDQVVGRPRLCVVRSFSKGYALAGLRVGFAGVGRQFAATWFQNGENPWRVGLLADMAARAALRSRDYYADRIRSLLVHRELLRTRIEQEVGCRTWPSRTHFFLLHPPREGTAESWVQRLTDDAVHIRHVSWDGQPPGRPFFRVTTRSRAENDRIVSAMLGWR